MFYIARILNLAKNLVAFSIEPRSVNVENTQWKFFKNS